MSSDQMAVRTSARLILERLDTVPPEVRRSAEIIDRGAGRMGGLIDDVLDFARGRLGGLSAASAPRRACR